MSVEEEAANINACLDEILQSMKAFIDAYRQTHTAAETLVGTKQDFVNCAYLNLAYGSGAAIVCDYAAWGSALYRLIEVEEQLAMHKAVITNLTDLEEL